MVTRIEQSKLDVSSSESPVERTRSPVERTSARTDSQAALELAADYIRASGIRDPNKIASLANDCVREARRQCESETAADVPLEEMALRVASTRLGLACAPPPETTDEMPTEPRASAALTLRPEDVVPPCCPRVMPEQKLDELLPIAEPSAWRKLVRAGTAGVAFLMAKVRLV